MVQKGQISSPGRICLYGEHQDYLGLPVIPVAINKRLKLDYHLESSPSILELSSKQLKQTEKLQLNQIPKLTGSPFDYQKVVLELFWNELTSFLPSKIVIDSEIPIRAGLSSSAALLTAMVFLINNIVLNRKSPPEEIAEIAYHCEHDLMGISCGRMDQYASSIGGVFHMTSTENPKVTPFNLSNDAYLIIGDSQIGRIADVPLKTVQQDIYQALHMLGSPDLNSLYEKTIKNSSLSERHKKRLLGVIGIRDDTRWAFKELEKPTPDLVYLGELLTSQQYYLTKNYEVSHLKLDQMCREAEAKGALGAKLTGAGFGGCMFALANEESQAMKIKCALEEYGPSFITQLDSGLKHFPNEIF